MKDQPKNYFDITNLGLMHYFLDMQIFQEEGSIVISQIKYSLDVLRKCNVEYKPSSTPWEIGLKLSTNTTQNKLDGELFGQIFGSLLMYLTIMRADIAYAVGIVSRYMKDPHI